MADDKVNLQDATGGGEGGGASLDTGGDVWANEEILLVTDYEKNIQEVSKVLDIIIVLVSEYCNCYCFLNYFCH